MCRVRSSVEKASKSDHLPFKSRNFHNALFDCRATYFCRKPNQQQPALYPSSLNKLDKRRTASPVKEPIDKVIVPLSKFESKPKPDQANFMMKHHIPATKLEPQLSIVERRPLLQETIELDTCNKNSSDGIFNNVMVTPVKH